MKDYSQDNRLGEIYNYLSREGIMYRIEDDGTSFSIHTGDWDRTRKINRTDHASRVKTVEPDMEFNRGIKRGKTILVTGDKPRFAMLRTLPVDSLSPDFIKLGDGRIRIKYKGYEEWLDNATDIHTFFHPWGTEYRITFAYLPGIEFKLAVSQAEDWGIVIKLSMINKSIEPVSMNLDFIYGGIVTYGRTFTAAYFPAGISETEGNRAVISNDLVTLYHDDIPVKVFALSCSDIKPALVDSKAVFSDNIHLNPGDSKKLFYETGHCKSDEEMESKFRESDPESLITESFSYYDTLLSKSMISTPSAILNTGFRTAVLNLDYCYDYSSWLEGVHWWVAPWVNNFQISAAISLGQVERALKALEFFGLGERGPCPLLMASGEPVTEGVYNNEDGLPYYLYTILQYFNHTGDREFLEKVWAKMVSAVENMLEARGYNKNGLLNFHLSCNAFMYQADHLQMPGDAASPSLIMAGMIERLAVLAERIGKIEDGVRWKKLSEDMYSKLEELLWNNEAGVFYNHIDLQGVKHMAHYYTDLVFPVLYTSLCEEYGWQSMDYLSNHLCFENDCLNLSLMRVGNFKPTIFGSDNVMPTQMSETARAYFKTGDNERGFRLLESVALAGTIYTEAPGNFPERMSDGGKGEANYIFGNPIGSFVYAVIGGLFGISLTDGGNTIKWNPSFPEDWDNAELQLSYAKVAFKGSTSISDSLVRKKTYTVTSDKERNLDFSVNLEPCRIRNIYCNGRALEYKAVPGLRTTKLVIFDSNSKSYEIEVEYTPVTVRINGMEVCRADSYVSWEFSMPVNKVSDPGESLNEISVLQNSIKGKAGEKTGKHMIFVELQDIPAIYPICFEIQSPYLIACESAVYDYENRALRLAIRISTPVPVNGKTELSLEMLKYIGNISLDDPESKSVLKYIEIPNVEMLPEGIYEAKYEILLEGRIANRSSEYVDLKGLDDKSAVVMSELRDKLTRPIDISNLYNASTIRATSRWRPGTEVGIDLKSIGCTDGNLKTKSGVFELPLKGHYMALLESGRSDAYTCETLNAGKPDSLYVSVGKNVLMVSLLYANEVDSRHTGARVGSIILQYGDESETLIPLIVGKNIDSLYTSFAEDTISINVLKNEWDDDNINILELPCNPLKVLDSIKIKLDAPDIQFGLIGVSIVLSI